MPRQRMSFKFEIPARGEGMTFIYALTDPTSGEVRYVGKADSPKLRLMGHLYGRESKANTHKARWIRKLLSAGLTPGLVILEQVPETTWPDFEKKWITQFRQSGARLTNATDGGEGASGAIWSEESRKKLSDSQKRIFFGEKALRRVDATRNRKPDPEKRFLTTEHIGVSKAGDGRWRAFRNLLGGKRVHLGYFKTLQDAIAAREKAEHENTTVSVTKPPGVRMPRVGREGHQGVTTRGKLWRAYFNIDGKQTILGSFKTFEEAVAVRIAAEAGNVIIYPRRPKREPKLKPAVAMDPHGHRLGKRNTSGVRGVSYMPSRDRWQAYFRPPYGKTRSLGKFKTLEEATAARKAAELKNQ